MSTPRPRPAPVMNQTFLSVMRVCSSDWVSNTACSRWQCPPNQSLRRGRSPCERGTERDPQTREPAHTVEDMAARNDDRDTSGDVRGDVRTDIREFLSTRRARISPEQAGLPIYGGARRRVTGLRREEVALLEGISTEYYTRLERGNATGMSESVIEGIAQALQLDEAERVHLNDRQRGAGTTRAPPRRPAQPRVRATQRRSLDPV